MTSTAPLPTTTRVAPIESRTARTIDALMNHAGAIAEWRPVKRFAAIYAAVLLRPEMTVRRYFPSVRRA
jgi:hypothetical protein